ncbi:MAG TPA: endonuclease/exonuclease/phosphatase family protein [bacterium]
MSRGPERFAITAILIAAGLTGLLPPDRLSAQVLLLQVAEIQGAAHISPAVGQVVETEGVVIARLPDRFWIQDPTPDENDGTSDGLLVFGSTAAAAIAVGDSIRVQGRVAEFRPGGSASANLTTTELVSPTVISIVHGDTLPAPTVVGASGRMPPAAVIEDDAAGSVETGGTFDPDEDGIDFYESLEGMRIQLNNAVAVGPTNVFGEIPLLPDNGVRASLRTPRGGIVVRPTDFNPERVLTDDAIVPAPPVKVGDRFRTPVVGVLDYSFGNFKLIVTSGLTAVDGRLAREVAAAPGDREIVVGTYNVENLSPASGASVFLRHAQIIVRHLRSPDLLAVEEIQDNSGVTDDGVTDASRTWRMLIRAIIAAGGPVYQYRQIDPLNNADGGLPGGNIRIGFLFRADRGLRFVDRRGGDATTPARVIRTPAGPALSISPGRVEPRNEAWSTPEGVRKPLAGEFRVRGKVLFVIANHWKSKNGDQPLFGRYQPPALATEPQRTAEARVVRGFVDRILTLDPRANVIVLGDFNDFPFAPPLAVLKGRGDLALHALIETRPANERYSYIFDGNSQALDHILVSRHLRASSSYDIIHVNAEFPDQASDHDPQIVRVTL